MRLSPLGIIVFIAFCGLLFALILTMPEPMVYSFMVAPMVIPRGNELAEKAFNVLAEEEPAANVDSVPVES